MPFAMASPVLGEIEDVPLPSQVSDEANIDDSADDSLGLPKDKLVQIDPTLSERADASELFQDMCEHTEEIKSKIRMTISGPSCISTFDRYFEDGFWQKIAKHPMFETVTLSVISLNALWMGVETDWNKESTLPKAAAIFQVVEHSFCTYFTVELFVRFMAFRHKCDGRKDAWFVFDSCLVFMMISEDWILLIVAGLTNSEAKFPLGNASVLRLLRLLRLSRLVRMLRSLPELMVLIKGMVQSTTAVMNVMGLLALTTYVFAIACTQMSSGTDMGETYFVNVALSMYSLIIYATFLDNLAPFMNNIRAESAAVVVIVLVFMALACLTLMNMLLGVLCEVISDVSNQEEEDAARSGVGCKLMEVAASLDTDGSGRVSAKEFSAILHNKDALRALENVGVDPIDVVELASLMFFDAEGNEVDLAFDTFMDSVFELRKENGARVRDIRWLWCQIIPSLDRMEHDVAQLRERFERIEEKVLSAVADLRLVLELPG